MLDNDPPGQKSKYNVNDCLSLIPPTRHECQVAREKLEGAKCVGSMLSIEKITERMGQSVVRRILFYGGDDVT